MIKILKTSLFLFLILISWASAHAKELQIGTIERAPLSFMNEQSEWTGFSIELWQLIAKNLELEYKFRENIYFSDMIERVKNENYDLAVANISVTSEREKHIDFSQPIYDSWLIIASNKEHNNSSLLTIIWESGILKAAFWVFITLIVVGHIMWLFEWGWHPYFRKKYPQWAFDAFWWAFIIVTMWWFENERPRKTLGRLFAFFWIVIGLFFISAFTANITSSLTVNQLQSSIKDYNDLKGKKVGVWAGTLFSDFLEKHNIEYIEYQDFWEALGAVESWEIDATIGETAILWYYLKNNPRSNVVLSGEAFAANKFAFAFRQNSHLVEQVNIELLKLRENGEYDILFKKYFSQ